MSAYLGPVVLVGGLVVIVSLLVALRRWTAAKQQQLSAEEFRLWFQKIYLGVTAKAGSVAPLKPGEGTTRTRKPSAAIHEDKPDS